VPVFVIVTPARSGVEHEQGHEHRLRLGLGLDQSRRHDDRQRDGEGDEKEPEDGREVGEDGDEEKELRGQAHGGASIAPPAGPAESVRNERLCRAGPQQAGSRR
jgi:hypothetical protein